MAQDSPLSIAASITGILTFVAAVVAGFYAHAISLKNAIDTQAEVSSALEKIEFLETETNMLNNAYLASQIRQPNRKYGSGDFKYFQGLYAQSLERMRKLDRGLRKSATLVTGGDRYDRISRVKTAATWMAARDRIHKDIEERKAESSRVFQIQLAMLSAKVDELSYHQNQHNVTCSIVVEELGSLQRLSSAVEANQSLKKTPDPPAFPLSDAQTLEGKSAEDPKLLAISSPVQTPRPLSDYHLALKYFEKGARTSSEFRDQLEVDF